MKTIKRANKRNNTVFVINNSQVLKSAWANYKKNNTNNYSYYLKLGWENARYNKQTINFDHFYSVNYNPLLFFVNGKINNFEITQEIVSESFLKVFNNLSIFDQNKSTLKTFLYNIATNNCIDFFRSVTNQKTIENKKISISNYVDEQGHEKFTIVDQSINIHELVENNEIYTDIDHNINILDEKYKTIAILYFVKNYKYREIAELLDININTVKTHIKRAKEQLQNNLQNNKNKLNVKHEVKSVISVHNTNDIPDNGLFYEVDNDSFYY